MTSRSVKIFKLPAKVAAQLRLLFIDPEQFFSNRYYTRNPQAFIQKLFDIEQLRPPNVVLDRVRALRPTLNVFLPAITPVMTGGPNTAVNLAYQIAASGIRVRLVSMDVALPTDPEWFVRYLRGLTGAEAVPPGLSTDSSHDPASPLTIGVNDMFMATYWTTAYAVERCLALTRVKKFIYLLQDFEPAFFPWSSNYALALATYSMNFHAIINEATLADFLHQKGVGRFGEPTFMDDSTAFQPAVDRRHFFIKPPEPDRPRRLLFYARPGRNLRGIGMDALQLATADPVFAHGWEFLSLGGGSLPVLDLANGAQLCPSPWVGYADYARLIRESDILLCLMLSPHTSYPVLEMVAAGGITVTNTFETKNPDSLSRISSNIIAAPPEKAAIAACLIEAGRRVLAGYDRTAPFGLSRDWPDALSSAVSRVQMIFQENTEAPAALRPTG